MRESIGAVSLLNFVIFFILLIFAFLMATFSYYKAFKVNNFMVSSIEKYEGFNTLSKEEMEQKMIGLGYQFIDFKCPTTMKGGYQLMNDKFSVLTSGSDTGYSGYCVYVNDKDVVGDVNSLDTYDSYQVTTIITFNFPIVQNTLKLRVNSKTGRIYNFECAQGSDADYCGSGVK